MPIPFLALILQGIPESIALAILGYLFADTALNRPRIIILGLSIAFTAYLIRLFPAGFGFHILAIIFIIFIFLIYVEKINVITALTSAFLPQVLLIVIEIACLTFFSFLNGQDLYSFVANTYNNVYQRIAVSWVHTFILFMLAYVISYFKKRKNKRLQEAGGETGEFIGDQPKAHR